MAFFQGMDHFSYFFTPSPTSLEYDQDDDNMVARRGAANWIHRFSHILVLGASSLLGFSILYIFVKQNNPRIGRWMVRWFSLFFALGLGFSSIITAARKCFLDFPREQRGTSNAILYKLTWYRTMQCYATFTIMIAAFELYVVVFCCIMLTTYQKGSHSLMMAELIRRFALYPIAIVVTQLPYVWFVFSPHYEHDDDYEWTDTDKALDGIYYSVPELMGVMLLLIYLTTKRQVNMRSARSIFMQAAALLPFLHQRPPEEADEEPPPHEYAALQDEELVDKYVEQAQARRLGSVFDVNTNPIRQSTSIDNAAVPTKDVELAGTTKEGQASGGDGAAAAADRRPTILERLLSL